MTALLTTLIALTACGDDGGGDAAVDGSRPDTGSGFTCADVSTEECIGNVHWFCEQDGEFLRSRNEDCAAMGLLCVPGFWCVVCQPDTIGCIDGNVARCRSDGSGWDVTEECEISSGFVCRDGMCRNLCELAIEDQSYVGCEFYAADLDNASIATGRDASAQQYAVVVSNTSPHMTDVWVERNNAPFGMPQDVEEIERVTLLPGDLEVFRLPRREVDGASSNAACAPATRVCVDGETCRCSSRDTAPPCFCRRTVPASTCMTTANCPYGQACVDVSPISGTGICASNGLNDGTHTAVTSQAYRVRSILPIIAYQFNPLDNVGVFSNDASLLLPTSAIGSDYTVVGWPQTIANGFDPDRDFDPTQENEDLRATLTILGTAERTTVDVTLGPRVVQVVGHPLLAGGAPILREGDAFSLELNPFDVINLETQGLNADFTGTRIEATAPVTVFAGSEASDAPRFETYATRQCCADHLEEQLFSDETLGSSFIIARTPRRTVALNNAFLDPTRDSVGEVNEPEWVRVVAATDRAVTLFTTLPPPDDRLTLGGRGDSIIIRADQDFILTTENAEPVAVLQTMASQEAVGIDPRYPGGDPAILVVPPQEQWRQDYVFLTPDLYSFDFVIISAPREAQVLLDGAPLDPARCTTSPADGIPRMATDPPPDQVIHRCQLSFPDVQGLPAVMVFEGEQNDGVHTVVADLPVGITVWGFDAFVSYAYAAGLNLKPVPR